MLILVFTLLTLALVLWVLYELTRTAKNFFNIKYNFERNHIVQLVILLLLIIFLVPYFFTLPFFHEYKSINGSTGEIGDTIGGLTAPFINGIGAILVYLAFKEQVKATIQTRNLESYKIVSDRLNWLKSDPYKINDLFTTIDLAISQRVVDQQAISKVIYLLLEFEDIFEMSSQNLTERENLLRQTQYIYRIIYRDIFNKIQFRAVVFYGFYPTDRDIVFIIDFMTAFEVTDSKLGI